METMSLTRTREALDRAKSQLRNLRVHGQRMTVLGTHSLLTVGGGAISGVLSVKMPKVAGRVDTDLLVGSAMCTAAMLDLAGDHSDELNAIGSGLLAAAAAREVGEALRK
jgi:hypothetical protein